MNPFMLFFVWKKGEEEHLEERVFSFKKTFHTSFLEDNRQVFNQKRRPIHVSIISDTRIHTQKKTKICLFCENSNTLHFLFLRFFSDFQIEGLIVFFPFLSEFFVFIFFNHEGDIPVQRWSWACDRDDRDCCWDWCNWDEDVGHHPLCPEELCQVAVSAIHQGQHSVCLSKASSKHVFQNQSTF